MSEGLSAIPCPQCSESVVLALIVPELTLADLHHLLIDPNKDLELDTRLVEGKRLSTEVDGS